VDFGYCLDILCLQVVCYAITIYCFEKDVPK
jgi:hypothetical protein